MDGWQLENEFTTLGVPVRKYRSSRTGLTVCIAGVKGPLVHGFLALATEAHDDDGLPHTLEHMVFMGSDSYPYKGLLDLLANRCFAQGTNAWTDTDNTCYTMTTAGSEGFLNLLPVYLDHVLFATCSESAYITEVHHITADGEDAGVVYCEMQARQNTDMDLSQLEMLRAMYPGECGYKSETGGLMENLRTSTSHAKVAQYHKDFYRPENLFVSITGDVDPQEVFAALAPLEEKIVSRGERPAFKRPWTSPVPDLPESVVKVLEFPTDEETSGLVKIAWRAASSTDPRGKLASELLWTYLADSAVAPLEQALVQIEDAYCNSISHSLIVSTASTQYATFNNVPVDKLDSIRDKVFETLQGVADGTIPFDTDRMASVVRRAQLNKLSMVEDYPQYLFAMACIDDCLYGTTPENLPELLQFTEHLKWLGQQEPQFWTNLISEQLLSKPSVTIVAKPSASLGEKLAAEEKKRVAEQKAELGKDGLAKLGKQLEDAMAANEVAPPSEVIQSVPVPSANAIHFHPIETFRNAATEQLVQTAPRVDTAKIPFFTQFDHINSSFFTLTACIDFSNVPTDLLPYAEVFMELLLHSPIQRGDEVIPYEEVVAGLEADTLSTDTHFGLGGVRFKAGTFSQVGMISLKVEAEKYQQGVQWLSDVLHRVVFDPERLAVAAQIVIGDASESQREGDLVARAIMKDIWFYKEESHSVHCATNMIRQGDFLAELLEDFEGEEAQQRECGFLRSLREAAVKPENLYIHVAGDLTLVPGNPAAPFESGFLPAELAENAVVAGPPTAATTLRTEGRASAMIGLGAVESSYLLQATPSIDSFDHPDVPAMMVAIEYLSALEGPLWRQVRGQGLAYSYFIQHSAEEGLLYFGLYRSSNVSKAYEVSRDIVHEYASGKTPIDALALEAAISSVVYEIVERVENPSSNAVESLRSYFQGSSPSYNHELLAQVLKVDAASVQRVLTEHFLPLFDPSKFKSAVCCNAGKAKSVVKELKALGVDVEPKESFDELFE